MSVKTLQSYKNWRPIFHSVVKDQDLAQIIHEKGYAVIPFLNDNLVKELKNLYDKEHRLNIENGGMFYSLYSRDIEYRKRIHQTIHEMFKPLLEDMFLNYKNIVNTFITKASGPESEFYVHQDTTALDEFKHSPLSIWIPLQDITPENGALGVIEKTHWFFSPYRGISFSSPFQDINNTLREYLKPIYLKAGDAIIFDPRIIHHSMPNISGKDRLVVLCGIFPKEAEFVSVFKDPEKNNLDLIKNDDSYILENDSFFYDCHSRPKTGNVISEVENDFPKMLSETFNTLCELNSIKKVHEIEKQQNINCQFIAEPDGVNLFNVNSKIKSDSANHTLWKKLKKVFSTN